MCISEDIFGLKCVQEAEVQRRLEKAEFRVAQLVEALEAIRDYEPQLLPAQDNSECPKCNCLNNREWPHSRLCEEHYREHAQRWKDNGRAKSNQHFAMRTIAREALT